MISSKIDLVSQQVIVIAFPKITMTRVKMKMRTKSSLCIEVHLSLKWLLDHFV